MNDMNKIAVVGTVFMDIKGFSHNSYDPVGTNIGDIVFSFGGVGRNAAENLANIGIPVSFLSTVDVGSSGDEIISDLNAKGIDTHFILRTENRGMGMWLAVLNSEGELCGSISQQPDLTLFENYIEEAIDDAVENCSAVVLEIDMSKALAERVFAAAEKFSKPVYAIVGNMSIINANKHMLSKTACFICNNIEAGKLINADFTEVSVEMLKNEVINISDKLNISAMIITNGEHGAVYFDRHIGVSGHQPAISTNVVDTTGAGDAFFSGTVGALTRGHTIGKACEYGAILASKVISSPLSSAQQCLDFFE